jgi:hypothetical protein
VREREGKERRLEDLTWCFTNNEQNIDQYLGMHG